MRPIVLVAAVIVLSVTSARAQSFEAAIHFASSQWSEFDGVDYGVGGRLTWKASSLIGVDADLTWYPSDFPPDSLALSGSRVEGLFGATIGPRFGRVRPFAKAAAGFLKVGDTPDTFACITIFPPPLACLIAAGPTMAAFEFGGGLEIAATDRTFIRGDVSDRMLKYPGPSFGRNLERMSENFWGHGLRLTVGAGFKF